MSTHEGQKNLVGCIDHHSHGDHELQLWIEPVDAGSPHGARKFVVRQVTHGHRCALETGSRDTHAETEAAGREAFDREKQFAINAVAAAAAAAAAAARAGSDERPVSLT